jgi:hypothetical protein
MGFHNNQLQNLNDHHIIVSIDYIWIFSVTHKEYDKLVTNVVFFIDS